jgi:hypothetical protein
MAHRETQPYTLAMPVLRTPCQLKQPVPLLPTNDYINLITMAGTRGHFEKGAWVEEPIPGEETEKTEPEVDVEEVIDAARQSVSRTVKDVKILGKTLFGTKKGREHLEKEASKAGEKLEKAINEAVEDARKILKKTE